SGGLLEVVQHKAGVQTRFQFISDDGRFLYYAANDVKPDSYALYRYELATKQAVRFFDQDGLWAIGDHRPDGKLLLSKQTGALTSEWWELEPATKQPTPLLGQGEKEEYEVAY